MALSFLALARSRVCVYIQMQGNALIAIYLFCYVRNRH